MATSFHFEHVLDFTPGQADEILRSIPALPGVFALCGARKEDAPYLTQTTDLRRRMRVSSTHPNRSPSASTSAKK